MLFHSGSYQPEATVRNISFARFDEQYISLADANVDGHLQRTCHKSLGFAEKLQHEWLTTPVRSKQHRENICESPSDSIIWNHDHQWDAKVWKINELLFPHWAHENQCCATSGTVQDIAYGLLFCCCLEHSFRHKQWWLVTLFHRSNDWRKLTHNSTTPCFLLRFQPWNDR